MLLRKLEVSEHPRTRALWESVFAEDTKAFLDYYYYVKTRENEIYIIEEEEIISMIQLNPYELQIQKQMSECHYIIGVATEKEYRGRGYMRDLLLKSMEEMYRRKEPFTFLMPAAEAIYSPYDFRFVYRQRQGVLTQKDLPESEVPAAIRVKDARFSDCDALSQFFRKEIAPNYQVIAAHTSEYYRTMIQEQQSEDGGVCVLREDEDVVGAFAYSNEGEWEVREPVCIPGYENALVAAIREVCHGQKEIACFGCEEPFLEKLDSVKYKNMIMMRILHLETLLQMLRVKDGEELHCSFAVLDPWIIQNNRIWHLQAGEEISESGAVQSGQVQVRETEDSQGVLTIGALTSFLFGYKSIEEVCEEEDVILTELLKCELQKIEVLDRIFLNEIV